VGGLWKRKFGGKAGTNGSREDRNTKGDLQKNLLSEGKHSVIGLQVARRSQSDGVPPRKRGRLKEGEARDPVRKKKLSGRGKEEAKAQKSWA